MNDEDDPAELERRLAQVDRLRSSITDPTTLERFKAFAEEVRQRLGRALARRRGRLEERAIRARAKELWEENGRPEGRDDEFWFAAEREVREKNA